VVAGSSDAIAMLARNVCRKLSEEWEVTVVKDDQKNFLFDDGWGKKIG